MTRKTIGVVAAAAAAISGAVPLEASAAEIAARGQQAQPAEDEKWQAPGVFAMVQGDETTSNDIFPLALNAEGVVRGNY